MPSPVTSQSRYGLDCLNFFAGGVQVGMGTFVAFYLAGLGWSKESVGLALATGQISGVLGQIPGGALTDATYWKRGLASLGILLTMSAALIYALIPTHALVFVAQILDGLTTAIVPPAIAAISLGLVGRRAMSYRTGRNYRFNAAGGALMAGIQGLIGNYFGKSAIFMASAGLCVPALIALNFIKAKEIDYSRARNAPIGEGVHQLQPVWDLARNRNLIYFTLCLILFQFADASLLPVLGENIGMSKGDSSSLQVSGLIAAPQLVIVFLAPWVGYFSEAIGRKPLLLLAFGTEIFRALLFATTTRYSFLFFGQLLDGVTSALVGVLTIVVITDLTTGTGRFNLAHGGATMLMGIASSVSLAASGFILRMAGHPLGFVTFAGVAGTAILLTWLVLPQTKPKQYVD
jgi:MFS family permease